MAATQNVGQSLPLSIEYLDQNGQPMRTTPTPDTAPQWANSDTATETLVASVDGKTAVATAVAAGADTVEVTLAVGGRSFTATLDVTVMPAAQTLTSIAIIAGVPS